MNLYGVLGRYIPAFGRIVGRMQYDLFHAYTVDAHTLFVVRNLRRFALPQLRARVPGSSRLMRARCRSRSSRTSPRCSTTSPRAAAATTPSSARSMPRRSASSRASSRYDARLVAWLVRNHLLFSVTAQKKDISDPKVIQRLRARRSATRPTSTTCTCSPSPTCAAPTRSSGTRGSASLFHDFYERAKRALRRGLEAPVDQDELVAETRAAALELLARDGVRPEQSPRRSGRGMNDDYFLRHTPAEIAWHTRLLADTRAGRHLAARRRARGDRARRQRGAHLHAAPAAEFRAHHRAARPDGAQHPRRAHHAARRRPEPRHLPRARGHRARRSPTGTAPTRSSSSCGACCRARRRDAARS
ncbi:MAG: hypothetical protein MZV65_53480 [Chromatiales bacterium]|nr:hypothetical protein [Chromatiales bacterium]